MARAVDERDMSKESVCTTAPFSLARWINLLVTFETAVACGTRTLRVIALVDLCVCVAELDGDVALLLTLEPDGLYTRYCLNDGGLAMSDVTDCTNIDSCLTGYDFGREGSELGKVEGIRIWLGR